MASSDSATAELQQLLSRPPPFGVNNPQYHSDPVTVALAALQALRDTGDEHFLFLRTILELPDDQELLFHCITCCRQVVLWRYTHYSREFVHRLREYMFRLGLQLSHSPSSRTCKFACYTTAAALWKRGWKDDDSNNNHSPAPSGPEQELISRLSNHGAYPRIAKSDLFSFIESLFQQNFQEAALFLDCLVSEFGSRSSVSYRLPLEFHKQVHRSFEIQGALNESLRLSMIALSQSINNPTASEQLDAVLKLNITVLGWEFGTSAWNQSVSVTTTHTLVHPTKEWSDYLARTDLIQALFELHDKVNGGGEVAHSLRQLLLMLASLSGPVFTTPDERKQYASCLCPGTLKLLRDATNPIREDSPDILAAFQLFARLISNFRLSVLIEFPAFTPLLQLLTATGTALLVAHTQECEQAQGDIESMDHYDWRQENIELLLECAVLLCEDPWLLYNGTIESQRNAQKSLSTVLGPLFEAFVRCRTRMAACEEHHIVSQSTELDQVHEEITDKGLEEEMEAGSTIGRLNLSAALSCLSSMFAATVPRLRTLWDTNGEVTAEASALLEEARMLTMYVGYLLTDDNQGETPAIPAAVLAACGEHEHIVGEIFSAVQALLQIADTQVQKLAVDPTNERLSPLLAKSLLVLLNRWAPAYLYPIALGSFEASNRLVQEWSLSDTVRRTVNFCLSLCLNYLCFWPQEPQVQESVGVLLLSLARKEGKLRGDIVSSEAFHDIVRLHCLTTALRHSMSNADMAASIRQRTNKDALPREELIAGYHRLPYRDKARVLTAILVACGDGRNDGAESMITNALKAIHDEFTALVQALASKTVPADNVDARETACLCLELFCGVAQASEMTKPERVPLFITTYLPQLSGLMDFYSDDLTVCEAILRFFRDYTAYFLELLDRSQSLVLFRSSAVLLKSYSAHHCSARVVKKLSTAQAEAEEGQAYGDILCAIQLLINVGAKDFIDACSSQEGVESSQVTDLIFFGLQQILPLMTQGLLQYPTLCSQFFELIGFMMDTYPEKVCGLPYELFDSLLESLLFGMSHTDSSVAKVSLQGLSSIVREHLESRALLPHLERNPDIFDRCSRRLLAEVVFQTIVFDRVEAAGMALLPLAAADVNRFAAVVQELSSRIPDPQQRARLDVAFSTLIQPEVLSKASSGGYEGRSNRVRFKNDFQDFVNEIQSFLVLS